MNVAPFRILLASPPERENLVVAIFLGREQVAEISHETPGIFVLEVFPRAGGGSWEFDLDAFQLALKVGSEQLQGPEADH